MPHTGSAVDDLSPVAPDSLGEHAPTEAPGTDSPTRRPRPRRGWRLLLTAVVVVITLIGALIGGSWLWVNRSSAGRVHTVAQAGSAPVALVLGAGLTPDRTPTPFLAARLDVAMQLYRAGKVRVLLVSGDNRTTDHNEPDAMRTYLIDHGIPAAHVVADYAGRDTYDSCVRATRIFGVTHLLVVSQGYHVPRAVALCRAAGLEAEGVGDWSMEQSEVWGSGQTRELLANVKALGDVLSGRDPVLGDPESGIRDALQR